MQAKSKELIFEESGKMACSEKFKNFNIQTKKLNKGDNQWQRKEKN